MTASDELFQYLDFLESESRQSRVFGSLSKASGLFCLATGAVTMATLPGWGFFALAGGVVYGGMLLRESRKTGRVMPVPFSELGIETIVQGIAKSGYGGDADDLLDYHYLSDRQKSDYALLALCAEDLGAALDAISSAKKQKALWHQVSRRFHQAYRAHIKDNPDFLSAFTDKSELLRFVLASPEEMRTLQQEARALAQRLTEVETETPAQNALPPTTPAIGIHTRLNAVEVASSSRDEVDSPGPVTPQNALESLLASPFVSRAFFGGQRTGKSYLAAVATRELASNGTQIYHLNLCSYGDEDGRYWKHATQSVRCDLSVASEQEAIQYIQSAISLVEAFYSQEDAILVVDEWTYITAQNNVHAASLKPLTGLVADKINTLADAGMKRRRSVWTIAPGFVASELTQEGKACKKLNLVLVAIAPGRSVTWNAQRIDFSYELLGQIKANYANVDLPALHSALAGCDRICYINNTWLPVGVDQNSIKRTVSPEATSSSEVDIGDFDSPISNLALEQVNVQRVAEKHKTQNSSDAAFCLFIDWLLKAHGSDKTISYATFMNANIFRRTGRTQAEWNRLSGKAYSLGLLFANGNDSYQVASWT